MGDLKPFWDEVKERIRHDAIPAVDGPFAEIDAYALEFIWSELMDMYTRHTPPPTEALLKDVEAVIEEKTSIEWDDEYYILGIRPAAKAAIAKVLKHDPAGKVLKAFMEAMDHQEHGLRLSDYGMQQEAQKMMSNAYDQGFALLGKEDKDV